MQFFQIMKAKRKFLLLGTFGILATLAAATAVLLNPCVAWNGRVKHYRLAVVELAKSINKSSNMPVLVKHDDTIAGSCPGQFRMEPMPGGSVPVISVVSVAYEVVIELRYTSAGLVCTYHWDSNAEKNSKNLKRLYSGDYDLVLGGLSRQEYRKMPTFGPGDFDLSKLNLAGYERFARIAPNAKGFFFNVPRVYYYNRGSDFEPPGFEEFDENLRRTVRSAQAFTVIAFGSMAFFGLPLISLGAMGMARVYGWYCMASADGWVIPFWPFLVSGDLELADHIWRVRHVSRLKQYNKARRKQTEEHHRLERVNARLRSLLGQFSKNSAEYGELALAIGGHSLSGKLEAARRFGSILKPVIAEAEEPTRTARIQALAGNLRGITNPLYRNEIEAVCAEALSQAETDYRRARELLSREYRRMVERNRKDKFDPEPA